LIIDLSPMLAATLPVIPPVTSGNLFRISSGLPVAAADKGGNSKKHVLRQPRCFL
jgi:hypothetical protein